MAEFDGDKQHDATPHRRQQAREEGQIARSQDLASAALLLIALLALLYWGHDLSQYFGRLFQESLGGQGWREIDRDGMPAFTLTSTWSLAVAVVPLLGVLMVAGIA